METSGILLPCVICGRSTRFINISHAKKLLGVDRSTIYSWMKREWIHVGRMPSGRALICAESLWSQERGTKSR